MSSFSSLLGKRIAYSLILLNPSFFFSLYVKVIEENKKPQAFFFGVEEDSTHNFKKGISVIDFRF